MRNFKFEISKTTKRIFRGVVKSGELKNFSPTFCLKKNKWHAYQWLVWYIQQHTYIYLKWGIYNFFLYCWKDTARERVSISFWWMEF